MLVETTAIPGILIVTPKKFGDERGFFVSAASRAPGYHIDVRANGPGRSSSIRDFG